MEERTQKIKELRIDILNKTYYVEVIDNGEETEIWLYNKRYGVKSLMLGLCETDIEESKLLDIIEGDIIYYIKSYQDEYEKD